MLRNMNFFQNYTLLISGLLIANAIIIVTSDSACIREGGKCQHTYWPCSRPYLFGKCSGAPNRQCCVPRAVGRDSACILKGGKCQRAYWPCSGSYLFGRCSGALNRCCVS